jgi:5-methylcytosine-specific restriction endonuclease McrA
MPYASPDRQREYGRIWVAARRAAWFAGKRCAWCDSPDDLQLDHEDPATKIDHKVWSWAKGRREAELAKCQALCQSCHRVKTRDDLPDLLHGTKSMYARRGCRCPDCQAWKSAENRLRYA